MTYHKHHNQLTPAQAERLALLLEELGEAQQAIGKILRHGYDSFHPDKIGPNNREQLEEELGHIWLACWLLCDRKDIDLNRLFDHYSRKKERVGRYLHHQ
jgi:NTP pyrophosphatase (non-canonical NTP hydrolase)